MTTESPPVVLVADDEPSMLALVGQHIKTMGYRVLEASDGEQAWALAQEHLPDLVILDVMMPGMSGWEVCRKIREDVALAHTAIIMLTGIGENLNELTSPLYGADSYIDKPFAFAELDDKVRVALHKHQGGPGLARTEPGAETETDGNGGREHRAISTPPTESGPPLPDETEQEWTGNEHPEIVNGADESVMLVKTESLEPTAPEGRKSALRPPSARRSGRSPRDTSEKSAKSAPAKSASKSPAKNAARPASNRAPKAASKTPAAKASGKVKTPAAKVTRAAKPAPPSGRAPKRAAAPAKAAGRPAKRPPAPPKAPAKARATAAKRPANGALARAASAKGSAKKGKRR
jgi:CheY-like chemotaxis protein